MTKRIMPARSNKEHALHEIRELILLRKIRPGHLLSEPDLAKKLSVSRTPIREALSVLAQEGLVEQTPQSRARVRMTPGDETKQILGLRYAIESFVACELANKRKEMSFDRLEAGLDQMREIRESSETDPSGKLPLAFVDEDIEWHCCIAQLSGFGLAVDILRQFRNRLRVFELPATPDSARMNEVIEEHEAILKAIRGGDHAAIKRAIKTHLMKAAGRWFPDFQAYVKRLK